MQDLTPFFTCDGLNPVQEKNGVTVTANLLTGLGIDEFFTRTDGVGVRALLPDALGSTVALDDNTGTPQTQYTYEPFGFVSQTGAASTSSYKYTGREDDGTGLMYYRGRYYQPRLQRFISEDPIGLAGGEVNLYGYVAENPLRWIDQLGLVSSGPYICATNIRDAIWIQAGSQGWRDNDKRLHCVVSCEIGRQCGTAVSFLAGMTREAYQLTVQGYILNPAKRRDSMLDVRANLHGLSCPAGQDCYQRCSARY